MLYSRYEPPSFTMDSERTLIGKLQNCIKNNPIYTGYPHKIPHLIIINDKKLLLDEFMNVPPTTNLYHYLKKHGFKPFSDSSAEGGVTLAICNYNHLDKFQRKGKLYVDITQLEHIAAHEHSAKACAFQSMQLFFKVKMVTPRRSLSLRQALMLGTEGDAESTPAWTYRP